MNRAFIGFVYAINAKIGVIYRVAAQAAVTSALQVGGESPKVNAVVGLLALGKTINDGAVGQWGTGNTNFGRPAFCGVALWGTPCASG
ncbi:hypothetical protein GCM10007315_01220 [Gemmobacter tilapiae]|uniref:Uncharacterized protein n=1 Tax=Neogemmobacter tilapiae TaxID=875041 RepID=A0A918TFI9_9RHOB|nr:hypothetical protein GCM10007315_01220 [Gemmobacter tilapiae]